MDYQAILNEIEGELKNNSFKGAVADYIPELAAISPQHFGVHLSCLQAGHYWLGQHQTRFSVHRVSLRSFP